MLSTYQCAIIYICINNFMLIREYIKYINICMHHCMHTILYACIIVCTLYCRHTTLYAHSMVCMHHSLYAHMNTWLYAHIITCIHHHECAVGYSVQFLYLLFVANFGVAQCIYTHHMALKLYSKLLKSAWVIACYCMFFSYDSKGEIHLITRQVVRPVPQTLTYVE